MIGAFDIGSDLAMILSAAWAFWFTYWVIVALLFIAFSSFVYFPGCFITSHLSLNIGFLGGCFRMSLFGCLCNGRWVYELSRMSTSFEGLGTRLDVETLACPICECTVS